MGQCSKFKGILRITEKASLNFNRHRSTGLVLLDLEKAFDSVWHDGLLHKLVKINTPCELIYLIASYLRNRKSYVMVGGKISNTYNVPAGVPQGSLLSPHLFTVFINDIPTPKDCELALYADDTAVLCDATWKNAKRINGILTRAVELLTGYFTNWKIKLNTGKTEFTVLTKSTKMHRILANFQPSIGNNLFEWKKVVTYLGVDIDSGLSFKPHIDKVISKTRKMVAMLYPVLKRNNTASIKSKVTVYRSVIRPIITYACPIFSNCPVTHFKKLQIQQNKCLRLALNASYDTRITALHKESGVPLVRDFVDKVTDNFYRNAASHGNNLVKSLGSYTLDDATRRARHRLPRKL